MTAHLNGAGPAAGHKGTRLLGQMGGYLMAKSHWSPGSLVAEGAINVLDLQVPGGQVGGSKNMPLFLACGQADASRRFQDAGAGDQPHPQVPPLRREGESGRAPRAASLRKWGRKKGGLRRIGDTGQASQRKGGPLQPAALSRCFNRPRLVLLRSEGGGNRSFSYPPVNLLLRCSFSLPRLQSLRG